MDLKKLLGAAAGNKKRNSSSGEIILGFGQHEVNIQMDSTPCKVSLRMKTLSSTIPVCYGDVNKISVTILDNGFKLFADIRTNSCCVEWACDV